MEEHGLIGATQRVIKIYNMDYQTDGTGLAPLNVAGIVMIKQ